MRYHINTRGEIGVCRAAVQCPFGDLESDHFDSAEVARKVFEERMGSSFSYVGRSLKTMDSHQLKLAILQELDQSDVNLDALKDAMEFATVLHDGQIRSDPVQGRKKTPYIEHPLRNTLRLVRLGVRDDATLQACVLHDVVEDQAKTFVEIYGDNDELNNEALNREKLYAFIAAAYSERAAFIVAGVTNPLPVGDKPKTREEKNRIYLEHVTKEVMSDPDVFLVKYSDFIDNAGSIHWSNYPGNERRVKNMAAKYSPAVEAFERALDAHDFENRIAPGELEVMRARLATVKMRLTEVLKNS